MKELPFAKPKWKSVKGKRPKLAIRQFWGRLFDLGCAVEGCSNIANIHHVRTKQYRDKEDWRVIPLCQMHHQGNGGIHLDPIGFVEKYGTQESLLIKAYELLLNDGGLPEPAMKIYKELKAG
jgi:hypothetical protein